MSDGHSTARSRSRMECRKLCMLAPSGTIGLSHLFKAALAELELVDPVRLYLGKANSPSPRASSMRLAAHSEAPTNGTTLSLPLVFRRLQGCGVMLATSWLSSSVWMSSHKSPAASASLIPVSDTNATNQRSSSSNSRHLVWIVLMSSTGMGTRSETPAVRS